jgi:hypothetical protein
VGADDASGVGRLPELDNLRRTGGGSPWRTVIGSAANSSDRRLISGYIFRAMGADSRVEASLMCSLATLFMSVGVVAIIAAAGAGAERTD